MWPKQMFRLDQPVACSWDGKRNSVLPLHEDLLSFGMHCVVARICLQPIAQKTVLLCCHALFAASCAALNFKETKGWRDIK